MLPMILSALGSAATSAGLGGLGAGLTAAGTTLGGLGGAGAAGAAGSAGTAAGTAAPAAAPFGLNLASMVKPVSQNLGTNAAGWSTTVTPAATPGQQILSGVLDSVNGGSSNPLAAATTELEQAPDPRNRQPIDFSRLLAAVNQRSKLGV